MPAEDHRLTTREMARFVADGFLCFESFVPEPINRRVIDELRELASAKIQHLLGKVPAEALRCPETLTPLSACHPPPSAIGEMLRLPEVQGIVQSLVGADPLFDHDFVNLLPADSEYRQHLHVDAVIDSRAPSFDVQLF